MIRKESGGATSVSIIIANFNGSPFVERCLRSVFALDYPDFEVVLVDDCSLDDSLEIVEKLFAQEGRLRIIRNSRRLGAAASRNRAIEMTYGDYIVFLDNDTEVASDWLKETVKVFEKDKRVGGTLCKLLDFSRRDIIQVAGVYLIPHTIWGVARGQGEKNDTKWDEIIECAAVSAALAVRREVVERIRGFDEKLAVCTEDLDFALRVWLSGYRILLAPRAIVYHWTKTMEMRKSMEASRIEIYFHLCKNSLRSILKNYEVKNVLKYLPCSLAVNIGRAFYVLLGRGDLSALRGTTKGIIWNIINLRDTLRRRWEVQAMRRASDEFVMRKIMVQDSLLGIYRKYFSKR